MTVHFKKDKNVYDQLREISDLRITWNFSFISNDDKYNFDNQNVDHKSVLAKLEEASKYSLVAFLNLTKYAGPEFLDPKKVSGKLSKFDSPDHFKSLRENRANQKWFSIRYSKSGRIIGKNIDNIFYIFWIDPNHDLYKSK